MERTLKPWLSVEGNALDTIARDLAAIVNAIGGRESLDRNEVQALWMRLYPLKCIAADAFAGPQTIDDNPVCVCGVHRSEHVLCGCEQFHRFGPLVRVLSSQEEDERDDYLAELNRDASEVRYCQRCEDEPTIDGGEYCEHCARLLTAAGHIPGEPKPLTEALIIAMFEAIDATNRAKQDCAG